MQPIEVKKEAAVKIESSIVPATTSSPETKTTVTFPAGSFNDDSSNAVLNLSVKSAGEFTVTSSSEPDPVAGIDVSLLVNGNKVTSFNGKEVVIETYIAKYLTDVVVKYNGTDGDQPIASSAGTNNADRLTSSSPATALGYNPSTGLLRFKTNHFSEYYVLADEIEAYNTKLNKEYIKLQDAINDASDGDTIVLLNNTSITLNEGNSCISIQDKGITIDGNGKAITLSADNPEKDTYGIYITGDDRSKIVTIKNTTINTTNLERAIRTEGNIGFKIVDSTITTNGVGVHVKGANKADICDTKITVSVIDEYSAHKRAGVVVGGPDAIVTVDGCTINAINESKTDNTVTWCKGLYAGNSALNGALTVNNTIVEADFSIAIDGTEDINKPSIITINSGDYSGIIGSPSGGSYKSLIIKGGTFKGNILDNGGFNGKVYPGAQLVISGGTFNVDPDSKFIVTGKTTIKEGDWYRVIDSTTEAELWQMIAGGNPTIDIYGEIELTTNLSVNRDVTIIGHNAKIKGFSTYIGANNNVKFVNVEFADTTKNDKASSVYGEGFAGTATFENCTFGDSNWESLQFTPEGDATIVIKDCSFKATKNMKRFIHVEPALSNSYKLNIEITGSTFYGCEKVNYSTSDKVSVIDLDYIAKDSTLTLGGCKFYNTDETKATNAHAYFCKPAPSYSRLYNYDQMYSMLTGTSISYTIQ